MHAVHALKEHLSFRLQTWDLNVLSLLILCSCGSLHLDQSPGKSLRSLRPGFRAFDSRAESVDVAHSFGTSCLSANPCQRLQGFADLPAELLMSCSLIQLRQKARVSKAQPFKIHFILLFSRQGKLRLQKWYTTLPDKEKKKIVREIVQIILSRNQKTSSFVDWKDLKLVYKRCMPVCIFVVQ
ncbi:AP-1 complex subunit sigma-3 isoform X3 [Aquila chrysaetos chrysaetos]|uniref:AP-1 complex subunit sigma-3 isoform X3 n=1 Tax=Aquila chrysaetos chrysaetos TaxID=223781 RepID=UPI001B7D2BE4|nr:AP-1 complex subunit sigma-3 isoform X3 [Aquila chrysaetos chrysaetos]